MHSLIRDVQYGLRILTKNPGFSGVAIVVLALGIGANTAVFSLVNAMLLQPIPSGGAEVVGIYSRDRTRPDSYRAFSFDDLQDVRAARDVFADVMGHSLTLVGTGEGDQTRRTFAAIVSAGYFSTLEVRLAAGRTFSPEEERAGSDVPVVIVGYQFARRRTKGPTPGDALGQRVRINARDYTIVGVAPEGFAGTMALVAPEFWLPTGVYARAADDVFRDGRSDLSDPATRALMLVGRLRPGVTAEAAGPRLAAVSERLERARPEVNRDRELLVQKLPRLVASTSPRTDTSSATVSGLLMGMAGLVLLISCLNLANMLLARGTARRREIAVRLAIGGSRRRIVRQLLTESLLIAIAGGAAGLLLAIWGTRALVTTLAAVVPMVLTFDARPDARVLAATMGFCLLSAIVAGLGPAWRVTRPDVLPDLKEQPADTAGGRRFSMRNLLVVGQIALSLALLTAAGLFARGAIKASVADPGFPLEGVIANVSPSLAGYDEPRGRASLRAMLQRVRTAPGVQSAGFASAIPFGEIRESKQVQKAGTPPAAAGQPEDGIEATYTIAGADYFETLQLPVIRGRGFTRHEEESSGGPRVAVVDEPLARRLFGGDDPVGQRVQFASRDERPAEVFQVVGVVAGVRDDLFDKAPVPHVYVAFGQNYRGGMIVHARPSAPGAAAEAAMIGTLRDELRTADAAVPVLGVKTLRQHREGGIALWAVNTGAQLFAIFGGVALVLAVVGLYGVKSYLVSRRTREIGIRMALGATASNVVWLVFREGIALTLAGVGVGLLLSWGVGRLLSGMLYEVSPLDPVVFAGSALVLTASALLASYLPARRATNVVPLAALRTE
jgi:predicted permease